MEDLRWLLRHLKIRRAAIGGLSMGGNAAWVAGAHAYAEAAERRGMEAFADLACANPLFARSIARGPEAERFIRSCLMTNRGRGIAHTAREVLAKRPTIYSLEPQLRRLRVPTLLIVGEHDAPCLPPHDFMARTIRGSRHLTIPGAGHLTNLEAPAAFNAAVRRFLRR